MRARGWAVLSATVLGTALLGACTAEGGGDAERAEAGDGVQEPAQATTPTPTPMPAPASPSVTC